MARVGDIMQEDVVTVSPDTTVRELTRILAENAISGAPVVTAAGSVLGVVSATDVVRLAAEEGEVRVAETRWMPTASASWTDAEAEQEDDDVDDALASYFLPEDPPMTGSGWDTHLEDDALDEFTVEDIMTPASFSIGADASLKELAEFLVRGRIHRAVVTDHDHLVGIVTTMDVLRAVAADRG